MFWDHTLTAGDLGRYPEWIVERVIEYGTLEDVETVRRLYGKRRFLKLVAAAERVSPRTRSFWRQVLEREGIECTRKYSRPRAWNC